MYTLYILIFNTTSKVLHSENNSESEVTVPGFKEFVVSQPYNQTRNGYDLVYLFADIIVADMATMSCGQ